jgi:hypothetical protein
MCHDFQAPAKRLNKRRNTEGRTARRANPKPGLAKLRPLHAPGLPVCIAMFAENSERYMVRSPFVITWQQALLVDSRILARKSRAAQSIVFIAGQAANPPPAYVSGRLPYS